MSVWILILGFLLYCVGISHAAKFLYNDDTDPLWSSSSLVDPMSPDLFSSDVTLDLEFASAGSGIFDMFPNDPDQHLLVDPTLISDCTLGNDDSSKNRGRIRRQTACQNPTSDFQLDLALPTLDQNFPLEANKTPKRPTTDQEKKIADLINNFSIRGVSFLRITDATLKSCRKDEARACSSENELDTQFEGNRKTYTLTNSILSTCIPLNVNPSVKYTNRIHIAL